MVIGMIKDIYNMCKEHNCAIDLHIGQDGAMTITVFGKHMDHLIIGADWNEETIKDCIKDTIRRTCNE